MKTNLLNKLRARLRSRFLVWGSLSLMCLGLASCAEEFGYVDGYGPRYAGSYSSGNYGYGGYPRYGVVSSDYYDSPYYDDYYYGGGGGNVYVTNRYSRYNRGRYYSDRYDHDHDRDHDRRYGNYRGDGNRNNGSTRTRPPDYTPPSPRQIASSRNFDNDRGSSRPVSFNRNESRPSGGMSRPSGSSRPPSASAPRPPSRSDSDRGSQRGGGGGGNDNGGGARKKRA